MMSLRKYHARLGFSVIVLFFDLRVGTSEGVSLRGPEGTRMRLYGQRGEMDYILGFMR